MFIPWYRWDSAQNRGSKFGYYGEYNRVSNALASLPGVTITNAWYNRDVSLEEFGFDVLVATGQTARLFFSETDEVRRLPRSKMVDVLKNRIESQLPLPRTNK